MGRCNLRVVLEFEEHRMTRISVWNIESLHLGCSWWWGLGGICRFLCLGVSRHALHHSATSHQQCFAQKPSDD
jgi:hypothetical protein